MNRGKIIEAANQLINLMLECTERDDETCDLLVKVKEALTYEEPMEGNSNG